jgi:mycothiol synthase
VITPLVLTRLSPQDVDEVRAFVDEVVASDGTSPFSEHVMLHLPRGGDADVRHLLVRGDEGLLGYAHLDVTDQIAGSSGELAVHPSARQRGIARALTQELVRQSPDGRLRLWAHGDHPGAARLASSLGFVRARSLWQMRRPLGDSDLPAVALAFADHPEQGGWGVEEVLVREAEPWFDPKGFFLAFRGEQLVGFHWTKVHGGSDHADHAHEAVGEVYIVGVDPCEQGHGLGPALTLLGLHHLEDLGLHEVLLYVDEENTHAIKVYERLGFSRYSTDVSFALTPPALPSTGR